MEFIENFYKDNNDNQETDDNDDDVDGDYEL
jgi:hypothetical protein